MPKDSSIKWILGVFFTSNAWCATSVLWIPSRLHASPRIYNQWCSKNDHTWNMHIQNGTFYSYQELRKKFSPSDIKYIIYTCIWTKCQWYRNIYDAYMTFNFIPSDTIPWNTADFPDSYVKSTQSCHTQARNISAVTSNLSTMMLEKSETNTKHSKPSKLHGAKLQLDFTKLRQDISEANRTRCNSQSL